MTAKEILSFVEYIDSFYNPVTGLYPIGGANVAVITKAIETYIDSLDRAEAWGGGDSVDREFVREIILKQVA